MPCSTGKGEGGRLDIPNRFLFGCIILYFLNNLYMVSTF